LQALTRLALGEQAPERVVVGILQEFDDAQVIDLSLPAPGQPHHVLQNRFESGLSGSKHVRTPRYRVHKGDCTGLQQRVTAAAARSGLQAFRALLVLDQLMGARARQHNLFARV
jgi:hypothetical protein